MAKSSIEWTEATWNPIVGCSIVSPGCTNCYAMKMAARIEGMNAEARLCSHRKPNAPQYDGTTHNVNGNNVWTGKLAQASEKTLHEPLRAKRPTLYFVNSMSDLFHENVPDEWIDQVFAVMALTPHHTYQVLTKRAARMRTYLTREVDWSAVLGATWTAIKTNGRIDRSRATELNHRITAGLMAWPLPNVWLGVSTERQKEADERIPHLLATPAAVRFISAEPLLGHISLHALNLATPSPSDALRGVQCVPDDSPDGYHNEKTSKLDWVIVGGESGPGARPMSPDWARDLRDHCAASGVPFFFKQWGEWADSEDYSSEMQEHLELINRADGSNVRVGKKRAGRLLDGILHDAKPHQRLEIT